MAGLGAKKQILIVGNDGVHLYMLNGKDVSLYRDFSNAGGNLSTELRDAFKSLKRPLIVLFDVVEQQYRRENIPKVGYFDKTKVITRKLAMAFPQQQMRAFVVSKQKAGSAEGVVALFAGLAPNLTITQIMDAILGSEVYIEGAGLLPLESTSLVNKLSEELHKNKSRPPARWKVLMTHHKTGGLRQIVVKEGELALTRMTPIVVDLSKAEIFGDEVVREFNATLTYLARFGYVPSDGLELCVISTPAINQRLRQYQLPVNELHTLTLPEAANLLKLKTIQPQELQGYSESLHAGWVAMQRALAVSLSSPLLDRIKNARKFTRFAIAGLVLGIVYLVWQLWNLHAGITGLQTTIDAQRSQQVRLKTELDAVTNKMIPLKYDSEKIKTQLTIYEEYKKLNIDIQPTLDALLPMVSNQQFSLREISVSQEEKTADPLAPPPEPLPDGTLPKKNITMELTIGFPEGLSVEQAARNTLEFADKLRKRFTGREIAIVEMVGDLTSDKTVQGDAVRPNEEGQQKASEEKMSSKIEFKGSVE